MIRPEAFILRNRSRHRYQLKVCDFIVSDKGKRCTLAVRRRSLSYRNNIKPEGCMPGKKIRPKSEADLCIICCKLFSYYFKLNFGFVTAAKIDLCFIAA